jgi:hypothetical protein
LHLGSFGRHRDTVEMRHLGRGALLDGDLVAGGESQVERGNGSGHVERNAVLMRQHRDGISSNLVGHVAVCGDAVGAHHHASDLAGVQKVSSHVVGDQGGGDTVVLQLPDGEPRALQERPGFIGVHIDVLA